MPTRPAPQRIWRATKNGRRPAARSANGVEIVEQHAYTVESVNPDGSLTLVNPWGEGSDYEPQDGAHRITVSQDEFDHLFDGVVIADAPEDWER